VNGDWEFTAGGYAQPSADTNSYRDYSPSQAFGSSHPSGFNVASATGPCGHVRFGIDATTWQPLHPQRRLGSQSRSLVILEGTA